MKNILILLSLLFALNSFADDLECRRKGDGFAVYNMTRDIFIGEGYYHELYICREAARSATGGIVCASNPSGSSVYRIRTGEVVGHAHTYYHQVAVCAKAVQNQHRGIVCVPRSTGSGVFDLRNNHFIGTGFYHQVDVCIQASSTASRHETCAPNNGGSAIYDRNLNAVSSRRFYNYVSDCAIDMIGR